MDLLLDSTGDLYLGTDGSMALTSSTPEAVAQRLRLKLDSLRTSWFLDETWGVRYLDDGDEAAILVKDPNIPAIVSELKSIIVDTEDVTRLASFSSEFSPSSRSLRVTFTVEVDTGEDVDGVVLMGDEPGALFAPEGSAIAVFAITSVEVNPCRV